MTTIFRQHRNRPEHIHDNDLQYICEALEAKGFVPLEFTYFNSEIITSANFSKAFPSASPILQPDAPGTFNMFNSAVSSAGSGITSSGSDLQFINTVNPGVYEFHINFSVHNLTDVDSDPETTIALADGAGTPLLNPGNGFLEVATQFEPITTNDLQRTLWFFTAHGMVRLGANATTTIFITVGAGGLTFEFGTFNVTVKRVSS